MGQQQLLFVMLGIIVVSIAIAVGLTLFDQGDQDANRDSVTADLLHYASLAQSHYKKPVTMGGGSRDYQGFVLGQTQLENRNGSFRLTTTAPTSSDLASSAPTISDENKQVGSSAQQIYIVGYGKVPGRDQTNLVMAYTAVSPSSITSTILN